MKILKVIFIVDKDTRYTFNVNDNITFKNLTKMIIETTNIGNIGLRIFKNIIECISKRKWNIRFFISQFTKKYIIFHRWKIDDYNKLIN